MKTKISGLLLPVATLALLFTLCLHTSVLYAGETSAPIFQLPKYEKFVLPNGMTVFLMERHKIPMIYISAIFPAGAIKDDIKNGLASFTADGMMWGTKSFTKEQIEEKLDFLGARCSISASLEYSRFGASFLSSDTEKVFPIIKEIITAPIFDAKEFDKHKKRLLLQLTQSKESPEEVIWPYFNKFFFGNHPYGNSVDGTISSVEKITIDDLKTFYNANYKPEESAIAIVGDFIPSKMKARITQLFNDWNVKGKSTAIAQVPLPSFEKNRILLVNKEDATETQFIIGAPGVQRNNPDYIAIEVLNTIFGGRYTSLLNDELRLKNGLTYGAGSSFDYNKDAGAFAMNSYTRTENTVKILDLAIGVLDRFHKEGITEELLTSGKNYIKGMFPPNYETSAQLAGYLTSKFYYNLDDASINKFKEYVDSLTLEKAKEIISKYFPKDKLQIVLIGKASEIRELVKKYGELSEKEIKTDGF